MLFPASIIFHRKINRFLFVLALCCLFVFGTYLLLGAYIINDNVQRYFSLVGEKGKTSNQKKCIMPHLDLEDPTMMKFFIKKRKPRCYFRDKDWVLVINGTIYFSPDAVSKHGRISCDYMPFERTNDLYTTYRKSVRNISNGFRMKHNGCLVSCKSRSGVRQRSLHQGVVFHQSYVDRKPNSLRDNFEGMSVAVLVLDGVSRMSWLRRLPETRKYFVETLGAIELESHNIVGDGTTAAMLPMLTGKFEWELPECRLHKKNASYLDDFPWIWKSFKEAGYLTSWSESDSSGATFNWRMKGFKDQPTDFYSRTFYVSAWKRKLRNNCIGNQHTSERFLNWYRDIFHMYRNQRKFLVHLLSEMSHDDNNLLTQMDNDLKNWIAHLYEDGYLNNTLLILLSDHGQRYPSHIRNSYSGKLEERLPYMSLLFPPWFEKKYPDAIRNVKTNSKRLTTPFDVHETFRDFFNYTGAGKGNLGQRGISLFKEIPLERTCAHADIAPHWCACMDWKTVDMEDKGAQKALQRALDTINKYTKPYRSYCALLSINKTVKALKMETRPEVLKFTKTDSEGGIFDIEFSSNHMNEKSMYQFVFGTKPGKGLYEVTVSHNLIGDKYSISEREISTLHRYGNSSHCVMDKNRQIRQYCYCNDLIK